MQPQYGFNCVVQPPSQDAEDFAHWCQEVGKRLIRHNLGAIDMVPFITENGDLILAFDVDEIRAPLVQQAVYDR